MVGEPHATTDSTVIPRIANTGKGLVAPFKLCIATLEMPYEVFGGIGDAVTGVM